MAWPRTCLPQLVTEMAASRRAQGMCAPCRCQPHGIRPVLRCKPSDDAVAVDEGALVPLGEGASPRQAEMHRRRRERAIFELQGLFEERIAKAAPAMLEALNAGPGAMAVVDNLLGPEHTAAMRREAVAVTESGLLKGSASAYSTAPPETFEERYGDEPGISASVLAPGTVAGELSPRCSAYITAASRALSRVLGEARRGGLEHAEAHGRPTDHQLRLTTVAQQVHMDNSFDGENRRLLTTIYYLNPDWQPEHGGRFLPWPCSDSHAADSARAAELPSTLLSFGDLPPEAQEQIPKSARCARHTVQPRPTHTHLQRTHSYPQDPRARRHQRAAHTLKQPHTH